MRPGLLSVLEKVNQKGWKKVKVEFTGGPLLVAVPPDCVELSMKKVEVLKNPQREIGRAIDEPCGGLGLEEMMEDKQAVVVIEWPEKIKEILPVEKKEICFSYDSENQRKINFFGY